MESYRSKKLPGWGGRRNLQLGNVPTFNSSLLHHLVTSSPLFRCYHSRLQPGQENTSCDGHPAAKAKTSRIVAANLVAVDSSSAACTSASAALSYCWSS